jgi:hypothetical protein
MHSHSLEKNIVNGVDVVVGRERRIKQGKERI